METNDSLKRAVFCDFDGTITAEETFVGMLRHIVPEGVKKVGPEMASGRMTLRDGVRTILETIPSKRYPEVLDYIRNKPFRPGFEDFLKFLKRNGVPFIIISGGLKGLVETRLGGLLDYVHAWHAADVDPSGDYLRAFSDCESDIELVAKAQIVARYGPGESAGIGDGITDYKMASAVSIVFARDGLARFLEDKGKQYVPWNDFNDVREDLTRRWDLGS